MCSVGAYLCTIALFYLLCTDHSISLEQQNLRRRTLSAAKNAEEAAANGRAATMVPTFTKELQLHDENLPETQPDLLPSLRHPTEAQALSPISQPLQPQSATLVDHTTIHSRPHELPFVPGWKANAPKSLLGMLKKFRSSIANFFSKTFQKIMKLRRKQPEVVPVLRRQRGTRVSPHERFLQNFKTTIRSQQRMINDYRASREEFVLLMGKKLNDPLDEKTWTAKALAELIGRKLAPKLADSKFQDEFKTLISLLQTYFENMKNYAKTINSISFVKTRWDTAVEFIEEVNPKRLLPIGKVEMEVAQEVLTALSHLGSDKSYAEFSKNLEGIFGGSEPKARFREDEKPSTAPPDFETGREFQRRIERERKEKIELGKKWALTYKDVREYFPPFASSFEHEDIFRRFTKARAIQLTNEAPEETHLSISSNTAPEDIVRTLPKDLNLEEETQRFMELTGFGKILKDIRPQVADYISILVDNQLVDIFPTTVDLEPGFASVLRSTKEEDLAWHERLFTRISPIGMSPSEIFEKLQQVPDSRSEIHSTLDESPQSAASPATEIRPTLNHASSSTHEDPSLLTNGNQINHPFIDELFKNKLIESTTRRKLHEAGKISKQEFVKSLGSEEEFKRGLLKKHGEDLIEYLIADESQQIFNVRRAVKSLTQSYLDELDQKAKSIYLTREAFLKPNANNMVEAWMIYDQEAIKHFIQTPSKNTNAIKAYVEAHFPMTDMDKFLMEIRIPRVRNNEGFRDYLEGFDEKLFELYDNPLKNEDERLKGTSFENMSEEERTRLNTIVHIIYIYQDELKAKIAQIQSLKRNIQQAEEYDLVAHLPQLQKILEDMSQKEK
ncbi:hypothetical protein PCANC_14894 [Puccinia coronata f. sp. avenae]|uniref:Uncharacterized protein n=1 Tax=Puccinia coronata f. sp. avenae TaxID=200324 RepID=A0A2N5UKI3_9BASI|nr:hypothetical protein PCANC_14894 [Puccinia coronata f. sp. avenae]